MRRIRYNRKNVFLRAAVWWILSICVSCGSIKTTSSPERQYAIVEIIGTEAAPDTAVLFPLLRQYGAADSVYHWKNRIAVYGKIKNPDSLAELIAKNQPQLEIKLYENAFYQFKRKDYCKDSQTASEWENILLTANLVKDKLLQHEYLEYHRTQFQKWPEVAQGFCNADFQQLLVFRNGRQLMLVISIPKGENLEELNPKTEENNPRVKEWNALMGRYQEGIPGTAEGEVWVFLEKY